MEMFGYRRLEPLKSAIEGNTPGAPPQVMLLRPDQLVVNEDYQRDISEAGERQIRRMAANWAWPAFKPPSVARTDDPDLFEVVDGQHTAIAAMMNGNIPELPCLCMDALTLEEKAAGFLGINRDRVALTQAAIYNARVAAKDEIAIAVEAAMSRAGVTLLASPPPSTTPYRQGQTMAIGAMLRLVKDRGEDRLAEILAILVQADARPVSAGLMKALNVALPRDPPADMIATVTQVLKVQRPNRLETVARANTTPGASAFVTLADLIAKLASLPATRMGLPPTGKRGPKPRSTT